MVAKEFSRNPDQRNFAVEHGYSESRPDTLCVFICVVGDEFREKRERVSGPNTLVGQVSAGTELEPIFLYHERRFGHVGSGQPCSKFDDLASQSSAKGLVTRVGALIDRLVAG